MENYIENIVKLYNETVVNNDNKEQIDFEKSKQEVIKLIKGTKHKIYSIGNGGSAAIASHVATDLIRGCQKPAICFSDYGQNTCLSNDIGYENMYSYLINLHAEENDILIAISSSGMSKNILNAVEIAKKKNMFVITFSGFLDDNILRTLGNINFYNEINHYGYVELIHQIILHEITDKLKLF